MRTPSRLMPKYKIQPMNFLAKGIISLVLVGIFFVIIKTTLVQLISVVLVGVGFWYWAKYVVERTIERNRKHLIKLAASRTNGSICEFSRHFNCREIDTWVIRATYEELQEELDWLAPNFPIQVSDNLIKDLLLDPDDIDLSLALAISARCGRTLDQSITNPYFGKVNTVADLVHFFNSQPIEPAIK